MNHKIPGCANYIAALGSNQGDIERLAKTDNRSRGNQSTYK